MERDEESGFTYHGSRYYSPWLARWTKCDPIGLADGINLYEYAGSDPVGFVDLTGTNSRPYQTKEWADYAQDLHDKQRIDAELAGFIKTKEGAARCRPGSPSGCQGQSSAPTGGARRDSEKTIGGLAVYGEKMVRATEAIGNAEEVKVELILGGKARVGQGSWGELE